MSHKLAQIFTNYFLWEMERYRLRGQPCGNRNNGRGGHRRCQMMRNTMQASLCARTRSLVIAMSHNMSLGEGRSWYQPILHYHNRPSPRLDAIQCSCHQAALNRFAIFACMVFRMMRHLRCLGLQIFIWLRFAGFSHTDLLKYTPIPTDFPLNQNTLIHLDPINKKSV